MVEDNTIIVTTATSGSARKDFVSRFKKYAAARNKKVKDFSVGEMILQQRPRAKVYFTQKNILRSNLETLNTTRAVVFERILSEIKMLDPDTIIIINMHMSFLNDYQPEAAFDHYYLQELKPDLFINLVDNTDKVVDRLKLELKESGQWDWLFEEDERTIRLLVMLWQGWEKEWTESFANDHDTPFLLIPSRAHESILFRALFEKWRKTFYLGMPLTFLNKSEHVEARSRVDALKQWLLYLVNVFDPRDIEPLSREQLLAMDPAVYSNVRKRDLGWMIPQCAPKGGMVAFYPEAVRSDGVIIEKLKATELNGDTFLIHPLLEDGKIGSPFLTGWSHKIFHHEDQFKPWFLESYLGEDYLAEIKKVEKCYNEGEND